MPTLYLNKIVDRYALENIFFCLSQDWPVHKLLMMLHGSAFVIPSPNNRRPQPLLEIQSDWKQVIAISGFVQCKDTREKLEAPCIVPRKVR